MQNSTTSSVAQILTNTKQTSTRLIENKNLTSNSLIEELLIANKDLIDDQWTKRHAKYCYKFGVASYYEQVEKAKKYGKNPKALLAHLINKELKNA